MLVVVLVAVLLAITIYYQQVSIARAQQIQHATQAYQYAVGLETLISEPMRAYVKAKPDELSQFRWPLRLDPIPVAGGNITAWVTSMQNRLNLAELNTEEIQLALKNIIVSSETKISEESALNIIRAIREKLEHDGVISEKKNEPSNDEQSTTENNDSDLKQVKKQTTELYSPSELRVVPGMDAQLARDLFPMLVILPNVTGIDFRHISPLLLTHLAPDLSLAQAQSIMLQVKNDPKITTVSDFSARVEQANSELSPGLFIEKSDYFMLHSVITLAQQEFHYYSLIKISGNERAMSLKILARSRTPF